MSKEAEGVWRTIRGRRIFIASGQSLGEAMAKSGKFKREDIREAKQRLRIEGKQKKLDEADNKRFYDPKHSPYERKLNYENAKGKLYAEAHRFSEAREDKNQAPKNRINENAPINKDARTRVERNKERYSETDRRELRREELQKRLDAEKLYNKNRELYHKHGGFYNKENNEKTNSAWKEWLNNREKARKLQDNANNEDTRKLIREYQAKKQSNNKIDNEYHFAGEELYSDDPRRYDDIIKSTQARKEKFKADDNFKKEKHIGWGEYNKDGVPVYNNDIDYKGDFGWANLKTLSDDDLTKALNIQSEEYNKANAESVGDRRTRNGRMNKIFKDAKVGKYEQGMKRLNEEMQKRDMPRYNIYDKKNPNNILVSSPTKEMADKQIQDMYKTDISLQKEYGWKELPKYDYRVGKVDDYLNEIKDEKVSNNNTYKFGKQKYNTRVEKNFDNYGRADKEEAINNEIEKTIKRYKQRKGK